MLTNLLPGLRDLRAPLSAGVIWLFAVWLAVEPELPPEGQAEGVLASVAALKDELSVVGQGAALAFVAYLVGSLSEALVASATRLYAAVRRNLYGNTFSVPGGKQRQPVNPKVLPLLLRLLPENRGRPIRYDNFGWAPVGAPRLLSEGSLTAVYDVAEAEVRAARETLLGRDSRESDEIPVPYEPSDAVSSWASWTATESRQDHGRDEMIAADIARRTLGEVEQMRTRLLLDQQGLFEKVDRLRAEAEFRNAVGPALFGLAVVLAWRGHAWSALLSCLAGTVLLYQGRQRQRESNDALVEALRNGRITSPAIDRLREDVTKEDQQPTRRETPDPQSPLPAERSPSARSRR